MIYAFADAFEQNLKLFQFLNITLGLINNLLL